MKQLGFKGTKGWGGKRRGAGRPNLSGNVSHTKRPEVDFKKPLQITHKLKPGLTTLRRKDLLKAFECCAARTKHFGMHVVHFSLLSNHIHMLVEARDKKALERGMRSLISRMAKLVAFLSDKKGGVFKGRYHLSVIKNPTQMKRSLSYVLLNQAKHSKMIEHMDRFSSARYFLGWHKLMGKLWNPILEWEQVIIDAHDPGALGRWWRDALGWVVVNDDPEEFEIRPAPDRLPGILFVEGSEPKAPARPKPPKPPKLVTEPKPPWLPALDWRRARISAATCRRRDE